MSLLRGMSHVDDARYNSCYSTTVKRGGCTPDTRQEVQKGLQQWVQNPNGASIYWVNGMAGTGKTTIAYSLCKWLEDNNQLGASFFCSQMSETCQNVNRIIPSIAYQLARYSYAFRSALCDVLKDDPDADSLDVVRQFEKLVEGPLLLAKKAMPETMVVVIDALDECKETYGVRLVLEVLSRLGRDLPLKFFLTSRPDPVIRRQLLSQGHYSPSVLHLHDIEESIVEGDITKYLKEALGSMSPPPSNDQIQQLAKRSGKLFIYAATAVRYILPNSGRADPGERLKEMLAASAVGTGSRLKHKELDVLYSAILTSAFDHESLEDHEVKTIRLALWTVICAREPMTIQALAPLLGLTTSQVLWALSSLLSVLHVSESGLVSTLHASFPDFMLDERRSGHFHCNKTQHNEFLAGHCLDVMKQQLRFNICDLESSFVFDRDVCDLEERIKQNISPTLSYACRYWGEHLRETRSSNILLKKLSSFLDNRLLFWIEVLNLTQCMGAGVLMLSHIHKWLSVSG